MALLAAAYPVPRERVRAIGLWAGFSGIGLAAVGFGLTLSPLTGAAIQAVSPHQGGLASGVSSTTRQIGAVLGVAVLGAVVRGRQSGGASFGSSLDTAFTLAGAVTLVSAAFTALFLARSRSVTPAPHERRSRLLARPAGDRGRGVSG